jgi:hypothetical protein
MILADSLPSLPFDTEEVSSQVTERQVLADSMLTGALSHFSLLPFC